jgi:ABC-type amino acid transport substrate-binding protein
MDNYPSLKLINKSFFLFLLVLIMLFNAQHAEAKRTVKAGIYDFKPMFYTDTDGSSKGFFVKILNHIAQKENWDVQYMSGTFQEGQDRLKNDQIDLLLGVGYTEERDKIMDFPKEFLVLDWGTIYKAKGSSISNIFDLEGKKVSILKGSLYPTGFQELAKNFHIHVTIKEMKTSNEVLASVVSGNADAGVAPNLSGILNKSWQKLERTPIIFTPLKIGYAVKDGKNSDLISAIDREITVIKADKSSIFYHELEHVMGKEEYVIPKEVYWALCVVVATLFLVIVWNRILKRQVRVKTEHLEAEITERRISEQKLFHEREFSNEALNSLPGVFYIITSENRFLRWNQNFETEVDILFRTHKLRQYA